MYQPVILISQEAQSALSDLRDDDVPGFNPDRRASAEKTDAINGC